MLNSETKRHIDAARDVLVGVAPNPTTQIDQITYALIYKFMDDMDQASVKAGGEASFFVGDLAKYSWSNLVSTRMGNQEKMDLYSEALTKFSEAKQLPELFRTIFRAAFLPYRSPETLGLFLKEISYFDYTHPEELGNAYEYLLSIMSSQGDAGQFRTPRHIIDFIVDVINPTKDDKVLDPACGTGGFLVSTYNHILEQHDGKDDPKNKEKPLTPDERKKLMSNLQGYDIDPTMVRIAQVNMYLHQFKNPQIFQYDSLTSEERWNDKYDVILANPPFMSPKGGIKPHNKFGVASNRAEVLFVDYIISHLKPKGRAGIVVPEGIIFQSGKAYKELRKNLVENGLFAVVSLPGGVFQPYSGVKTSILLFDSELAKSKTEILFVKISADGFHLSSSRKVSGNNDLPLAYSEITRFVEGKKIQGKISLLVSKSTISLDDNYFLSVERYQESPRQSGITNLVAIGDILELAPTEKVGSRDVPIMSITMARGLIDQGDKFKRRIASESISDYKLVRRDNLVVGFPIDEGVLGFLRKYEFAAVSPAYGIWQLKNGNDINLDYLEKILRSTQMRAIYAANMQGAVSRRRSVPKDVFTKLTVPIPSLEEQEQLVAELNGYEAIISGANQIVENWRPIVEKKPEWDEVAISDVCTVIGGGTPDRKEAKYWGPGIPWLSSRHIGDDHTVTGFEEITKLGLENSSSKVAPANSTILITRVSVGKYAVADKDYAINQDLTAIISNSPMLDEKFLSYVIGDVARNVARDAVGVGVTGVTRDYINRSTIPLPPISTQREIVRHIEEEFGKIQSAKALIETYEARTRKVISNLWSEVD